jgi:hypothetical protein
MAEVESLDWLKWSSRVEDLGPRPPRGTLRAELPHRALRKKLNHTMTY